jgi:CDP-diacylglycerol--glycerol-3-phosphate 3-phosphatidyltransferase
MPDRSAEIPSASAAGGAVYLTWPNALTALRMLMLPLFIWILLTAAVPVQPHGQSRRLRWLAAGVFAVMALTDKLDGCLARRFNQITRLGAWLDPLADKLLIGSSLILLSFPWIAPAGYEVPVPVILAVYGKDLGVAIGAVILLAAIGKLEIASCPSGKLSTVLQLLLVLLTLLSADLARLSPLLTGWTLYALWWAVVLAAALSTLDYIAEGSYLYARRRGRFAESPA